MDQSKLTAYRESARVAAKLADFYKDFTGLTVGMQMLIGDDIPTLATAVDELVAEVERLQGEYARGRADERAAVVAWLSSEESDCRARDYNAIERGEHVAEVKDAT